jgi:hypothetical protein
MSEVKVYSNAERQAMNKEIEQLEAARKAAADRLKELKKNKGVTFKQVETRKGPVGFTIQGMGIPKFFYKQQALDLLDDTEEAKALRLQCLQWIEEHNELTDKE